MASACPENASQPVYASVTSLSRCSSPPCGQSTGVVSSGPIKELPDIKISEEFDDGKAKHDPRFDAVRLAENGPGDGRPIIEALRTDGEKLRKEIACVDNITSIQILIVQGDSPKWKQLGRKRSSKKENQRLLSLRAKLGGKQDAETSALKLHIKLSDESGERCIVIEPQRWDAMCKDNQDSSLRMLAMQAAECELLEFVAVLKSVISARSGDRQRQFAVSRLEMRAITGFRIGRPIYTCQFWPELLEFDEAQKRIVVREADDSGRESFQCLMRNVRLCEVDLKENRFVIGVCKTCTAAPCGVGRVGQLGWPEPFDSSTTVMILCDEAQTRDVAEKVQQLFPDPGEYDRPLSSCILSVSPRHVCHNRLSGSFQVDPPELPPRPQDQTTAPQLDTSQPQLDRRSQLRKARRWASPDERPLRRSISARESLASSDRSAEFLPDEGSFTDEARGDNKHSLAVRSSSDGANRYLCRAQYDQRAHSLEKKSVRSFSQLRSVFNRTDEEEMEKETAPPAVFPRPMPYSDMARDLYHSPSSGLPVEETAAYVKKRTESLEGSPVDERYVIPAAHQEDAPLPKKDKRSPKQLNIQPASQHGYMPVFPCGPDEYQPLQPGMEAKETGAVPHRPVTTQFMNRIAYKVSSCCDYYPLAVHLDLPEDQIQSLREGADKDNYSGCRQALMLWRESPGTTATYAKLMETIEDFDPLLKIKGYLWRMVSKVEECPHQQSTSSSTSSTSPVLPLIGQVAS